MIPIDSNNYELLLLVYKGLFTEGHPDAFNVKPHLEICDTIYSDLLHWGNKSIELNKIELDWYYEDDFSISIELGDYVLRVSTIM